MAAVPGDSFAAKARPLKKMRWTFFLVQRIREDMTLRFQKQEVESFVRA
jgi:hypothetical protein